MSEYSIVAHRELTIMNPISSSTLDEVVGQLDLSANARAIDIGCGKGELLRRIAGAYACKVEGVESSAALVEIARRAVPSATFRVTDARTEQLPANAYDLTACLGASHALGGKSAVFRLSRATRVDGLVLFGEAYWRREPAPEYLAATRIPRAELASMEETVERAWAADLALRDAFLASEADFTRYEASLARAIAAHARDNPESADAAAMHARSRAWYEAFERWGHNTLGFALFLFAKRD